MPPSSLVRHSLTACITILLLNGCSILRDPAGHGVQPALDARANAKSQVVAGTPENVYRKVLATADAYAWTVFREFPDENLVVFSRIPGAVDSTQVAVFCSETDGGVLVEVASQSMYSRELAAKILFKRL